MTSNTMNNLKIFRPIIKNEHSNVSQEVDSNNPKKPNRQPKQLPHSSVVKSIKYRPASPFLHPSTPKPVTVTQTISTPRGRNVEIIQKEQLQNRSGVPDLPETKSSLLGTYANLVNILIGAGIIAIPYAFRQTGLVVGIILIFIVATLSDKSLRLLIETGKHADVSSYERLMEAAYGYPGFIFVSFNMFILSYGSMICYLLIIKDTLPVLLGFGDDDLMKSRILIISTMSIILPLSMKRDIADLSKTSTINITFDILIALIVALYSPIEESISENDGLWNIVQNSTIHPQTMFVGLGVLTFAFVCQDSSFIIAGSLERPTKERWSTVTKYSLLTCASLSCIIGTAGYIGFLGNTEGNILNSFSNASAFGDDNDKVVFSVSSKKALNIARALLCSTMFFVYPLSSYVARHAVIVLFFRGRRAHDGDDHTVLARTDRRVILTFALYICALLPAWYFQDLGIVISLTGAVGASCLSYIGPGIAYLGIHGLDILNIISKVWSVSNKELEKLMWKFPQPSQFGHLNGGDLDAEAIVNNESVPILQSETNLQILGGQVDITKEKNETMKIISIETIQVVSDLVRIITWYILNMPLWCLLATKGHQSYTEFQKIEASKSPAPKRLGKIVHLERKFQTRHTGRVFEKNARSYKLASTKYGSFGSPNDKSGNPGSCENKMKSSLSGLNLIPYSDSKNQNLVRTENFNVNTGKSMLLPPSSAANITNTEASSNPELMPSNDDIAEDDPQEGLPQLGDFLLAIFYVILGFIAMFAGLLTID